MTWGKNNMLLWKIEGHASVQGFYDALVYLNDTTFALLDGTAPPSRNPHGTSHRDDTM